MTRASVSLTQRRTGRHSLARQVAKLHVSALLKGRQFPSPAQIARAGRAPAAASTIVAERVECREFNAALGAVGESRRPPAWQTYHSKTWELQRRESWDRNVGVKTPSRVLDPPRISGQTTCSELLTCEYWA